MKPVELPGALCVGIPEAFEVAGKTAKQIRRAVYTCHRCPALQPCADDPSTTVDMVRAGRVYGMNGKAHPPEIYIRRWQHARTASHPVVWRREGSTDGQRVEANQ